METKFCKKCQNHYPLTEFHKDKTRPGGLNAWCKTCKREERFAARRKPENYLKRRWDSMAEGTRKKREITYEELLELFNNFCNKNLKEGKHQYSCRYTGDVMTFSQGEGHIQTNLSIDRIDNNKTYTKDNITFCTQNFNHKKGQLTVDTMMKVWKVFKEKGII